MRLLLIQDDAPMAARLSERLRGAGFAVDITEATAHDHPYPGVDAMLLDPGLPDGAGLLRLQAWQRAHAATPLIALSARGRWQDKVDALNAGAEDFVVKPVRFDELLARLHMVLSRHQGADGDWIERGGLRLDTRGRKAERNGQPLALTRMEFRLLHLFLRHPGKVLSQGDILDHLYEEENERHLNAVEVLISRLRRKIGATRIETVRGLGYRFVG